MSGPVGNLMSSTTSSSIQLNWTEPVNPHGILIHYKVCWQADRRDCDRGCEADVMENCENVTILSWSRNNLCSYRHFDLDVSACNSIGYGIIASAPAMTLEDGETL